MKTGDQVICTYDYVTHDGRKLFSIGDIATVVDNVDGIISIKLKDIDDFLKMRLFNDIFVVDYVGDEYFKLFMTKEQLLLQQLIPEETQHLLINSLINYPLRKVCGSDCGEFDLDFALREYCRMSKIILTNAVKTTYTDVNDESTYKYERTNNPEDQHLVKTYDNLRFSILSYYTMIINNAYENMVLDEYYVFYQKLLKNIISLSHVYTDNFVGGALSSDIIFCLSSTNFQLEKRRLNRIKQSQGISEVTSSRRAELLSIAQDSIHKSASKKPNDEPGIHPMYSGEYD